MTNHPRMNLRYPSAVRQWMTIAAFLCIAGDAWGQFPIFHSWSNAGGGSYADPFNWDPSGVPGPNDGAGFALNDVYTVAFPSDQTTGTVTVSGGGIAFDLNTSGTARTLMVPGTLTVRSSSSLSVRDGVVAAGNILVEDIGTLFGASTATIKAADGSVIVRGAGSIWQTQNGFLRVGESGNGTLLVEDGGLVNNSDGAAIGRFTGSTGMAAVTGNNSMLDIDATLTIGQEGGGTLFIEDGGAVKNVLGRIAFSADSVGSVTVSGEGSAWTNTGSNLFVGESGNGALNITGGGVVMSGTTDISRFSGSVGAATVDGAGSLWSIADGFAVGTRGQGTLSITGGGTVENVDGIIGSLTGAHGTVTVSGQGSTWTNSGELFVGNFGTGELTFDADGSVSSANGVVGADSSATGTVTVTGAGSNWTNSDDLVVGESGQGSLLIDAGGGVENNNSAFIGREDGSTGTVTVRGATSTWTIGNQVRVGDDGVGTLLIEVGGTVSSDSGSIGFDFDSNGSVTVSGASSTWTNDKELRVGDSGDGTLLISAGGRVDSAGGLLAWNSTSLGSVTVTGEGSAWINSDQLRVGELGQGTLRVEAGGSVQSDSGTSAIGSFIGFEPNSSGAVTVTGAGSTWTNEDDLLVGFEGDGTLTIADGGLVEHVIGNILNPRGFIGDASNSTGQVTVTGAGSRWNIIDDLRVGNAGEGTLTIADGGSVENARTRIAAIAGSTGTVTVTGADSTWTISGDLRIGNSGMGGSGTLTIDTGGTVSVGDETVLFPNGSLQLQGGTLVTSEFRFDGGGTFDWKAGTLHVERYLAPLQNQAGTLAPGLSAGSTTIIGQYTQDAGATLQIDIGGTAPGTDFDILTIEPLLSSDDALLDGALDVALIDNFLPALGSSFTIVQTTAGNVIGTFADEILPVFNGLTFDVIYNPQSVVLEVVELTGLSGEFNGDGTIDAADYALWRSDPSSYGGTQGYTDWVNNFGQTLGSGSGSSADAAVPEPASCLMLILGAAFGICRRRRVASRVPATR